MLFMGDVDVGCVRGPTAGAGRGWVPPRGSLHTLSHTGYRTLSHHLLQSQYLVTSKDEASLKLTTAT